jgi:hypothetical protein
MRRKSGPVGVLIAGFFAIAGPANAAPTCDLQKALDDLLNLRDSQPIKFLKQEVDDAAGKLAALNACTGEQCFFPSGSKGDPLRKRLSDGITLRRADLQSFLKAVIAVKRPDCQVCDLYDRWALVLEVYGEGQDYWHPAALAKIDASRVQMAKAMRAAQAAIGGNPSDPYLIRAKRSIDDFINVDIGKESQAYHDAWHAHNSPADIAETLQFHAQLVEVAKNPSLCEIK